MTTRTWDGTSGLYTSASDWSPVGVPAPGDTAVINAGTVTVGSADLTANLNLTVGTSGSAAPTLILQSTTTQPSDIVQLGMPDQSGTPSTPTMTASALAFGNVVNSGRFDLSRATLSISGTFTNTGTLELEPYAAISLASATASLVNNGTVVTFKPFEYTNSNNNYTTTLLVRAPITGTGSIVVNDGFNLQLDASVGVGQTVSFGRMVYFNEAQTNNVLTIDDLTTFKATIAQWGPDEPIVATGLTYNSVQTTLTNNTTTLNFREGSTVVDTLTFSGRFSAAQFSLSSLSTPDGREQTTITYMSATAPAGPLSVCRYFSMVNGTQFLTASVSEATTVSMTRPDLVKEAVSFEAVNPADNDPTAAPVYRFFDTVDGTHFFTASPSERDTIIATRPDLTYEPTSTFYEHATAQTGDQAVYRFFERTNGTHFYTASASERASILSTRPDLVPEGVAFYAPTS